MNYEGMTEAEFIELNRKRELRGATHTLLPLLDEKIETALNNLKFHYDKDGCTDKCVATLLVLREFKEELEQNESEVLRLEEKQNRKGSN